MPAVRHVRRSIAVVAALSWLASVAVTASGRDAGFTTGNLRDVEQESVQKLLERGALDQAVQRAAGEGVNPESIYLAAQALIKMDNNAGANEQLARLRDAGDDWSAIGESGQALLAGDAGAAMSAATRAVAANGDNPYAHYQLGLVASRQGDFQRAAEAFGRSVELKPDFAYGHYYAGLANQRLKQTAKTSQHLETFMRLAPDAPERVAVAGILRTLKM
jgi:tetratricopeptide (TPR) repeat protein